MDTKDWTSCKLRKTRQLSVVECKLVKSFQKGTEKFLPTALPAQDNPRAFPAREPKKGIRQGRVKSEC